MESWDKCSSMSVQICASMHSLSTNGSKEEYSLVYGRAKLVLIDNLLTGTATPGSNCVENIF